MLKIGDLSKLSKVSVKTLRYYDEMGLLKPAEIDRFTGYRYYSIDQLPRLNRIRALQDLGLSLDEIRRLLEEKLPPAQLRGMLRLKRLEIQERLEEERQRLARVEQRLIQIEQEDSVATDVVIKKLEPIRVASIRRVVATFDAQGELWGELGAFLTRHKLNPVGPCLTVYYDPEYRERDVDIEVCEMVSAGPANEEGVCIYDLPPVPQAASILHRGGFENIGATYGELIRWIEANGYRIAGPNREVYLRALMEQEPTDASYPKDFITKDPNDRLSEVQFPVVKA